jgi:hypothetical protein
MADNKKAPQLTPQQQLAYFNDNTSLYKFPVDSKSGTENGTVKFQFEPTKMLAKTYILITATLTSTQSGSANYAPHEDGVWNFIKKVSLVSHKGFRPFDICGSSLKMLNYANLGATAMAKSTTDGRYREVQGIASGSSGTANVIKLLIELPNVINDRDLAGLILLQNDKVNISLEVTLGAVADLAPAAGGYSYALSSINVAVYNDLFSVPEDLNYYPIDLVRTVKLNHEFTQAIIVGDNKLQLTPGNTYRRIFLQFFTSAGVRAADSTLGDIYLILSGSNYRYQISPYLLSQQNKAMGIDLPYGCFVLDFASGQGLRNLAGGRDYIESDELGEMYIRVSSSAVGSVLVYSETLTTMQ